MVPRVGKGMRNPLSGGFIIWRLPQQAFYRKKRNLELEYGIETTKHRVKYIQLPQFIAPIIKMSQ